MRRGYSPLIVALVAASALVAPAVGQAAAKATAVPTSVKLFTVSYQNKSAQALVSVQKLGGNSVRVTGLFNGLPAFTNEIALVPSSTCANGLGSVLIRHTIPASGVFDFRGQLSAPLGGGARIAVYFDSRRGFVCLALPAFVASGAANWLYPGGNASQPVSGLMTMQRRPAAVGIVILNAASTQAVSSPTVIMNPGSCSSVAAPTKANTVTMYKKQVYLYGDIFASKNVADFPIFGKARSLVLTTGAAKQPVSCVKWSQAQSDALTA